MDAGQGWELPPAAAPAPLPALGAETRQALARGPQVVDTQRPVADGLDKCPRCGSTDIAYSITLRALYCSDCRSCWNEPGAERAFGLDAPIMALRGHQLGSAVMDVREDASLMTLRCQGCGAEIMLRVAEQLQVRCHWCRQKLSVSTQVATGAVPDGILPFTISREDAVARIASFIGSRRRYARSFVTEHFRPENVFGVYIPYLVVDGNVHAELHGKGEVTTRTYQVKQGDTYVTYHDAHVHQVDRSFDLLIDDLAVGSSQRFTGNVAHVTNHVVRALAPYDTENAVVFSSNYLTGFSTQRRDLDVTDVDDEVENRFLAIARTRLEPTIAGYDRGVRWEHEGVAVRGTRWVSVLVPVWLYSYSPPEGPQAGTHYIAVNGRSGITQGSVPVSSGRIWLDACIPGGIVAGALGALGLLLMILGAVST
ncbi:TFIIB-type zinc ribbon-containing protein [Brachybacterium hainanense]|uniref:TFIIB-type zinc ribbon-containing protein n=1 Tax=Brachybacterium hainanense TaxID=1541174 RepID=A0ABV6RHB4_9MICO